jgi:putative addiction module component (TIGR02574 family)
MRRYICGVASESDSEVFANALALPASERAKLARALISSLDDEVSDPDVATEWRAEIERRAREVLEGSAELRDWSVVREELATRWRKR